MTQPSATSPTSGLPPTSVGAVVVLEHATAIPLDAKIVLEIHPPVRLSLPGTLLQ